METGDPGAHGDHVTLTQEVGKEKERDYAIILQPEMEVATAQGHLIQLQYVRYFNH